MFETSERQGETKERQIPKRLGSIKDHDLCSQTLSQRDGNQEGHGQKNGQKSVRKKIKALLR